MDQWAKDNWHKLRWHRRALVLGAPWSWLQKAVTWMQWNLLGGEVRHLRMENRALRGDCAYLDETNRQLSADVATLLAGYHQSLSGLVRSHFETPSRRELCGARLYLGRRLWQDRLEVEMEPLRYSVDMSMVSPAYIDRYVGEALKFDIIGRFRDHVEAKLEGELSKVIGGWVERRMKARIV